MQESTFRDESGREYRYERGHRVYLDGKQQGHTAAPIRTQESSYGPPEMNELIQTMEELRSKIETSNSEAFRLADIVVPEQARAMFDQAGITDLSTRMQFYDCFRKIARVIKSGDQAQALHLLLPAIQFLKEAKEQLQR